jgi:hypothetical protein
MPAALKGPDITKKLFGGVLDIDGAGHYPGLELLNFVLCSPDGVLPGPEVVQVRITRRSHAFARRLVAVDSKLLEDECNKVLLDSASRTAIVHLLRCVELAVPNAVKSKSWERTHFFPYTRSLVHWDARIRNETFKFERRYLRGGGAFAFAVLRHDPDPTRLASIRAGFNALYPIDADGPLEKLSSTLMGHGPIDDAPVKDTLEGDSLILNDDLDELYRDGIASILSHRRVPQVQRIRAIMNWTGIWLVLLEATRAARRLGKGRAEIILDCAGAHPQLRRAAQRCLKDSLADIEEASIVQAKHSGGEISRPQRNKIKGFFGGTASLCGLLNAPKGRRHFTLKLEAIEALVLACGEKSERSYEEFTADWLGRRCGLIVGRISAGECGLLNDFDASIFEENERQFAEQMRATGMLRVYSDATRMVSAEVMQ